MVLSQKKKVGVFIAVAVFIIVFLFISQTIFNSNALNPLASVNESGKNFPGSNENLIVKDIAIGSGQEAREGDLLVVHYSGVLKDGRKFDSSLDRGAPIEFTLGSGQVISGWDLGLVGMKVGGIRSLTIPPELGYGENQVGPIPGGSTLIFEVELIEIK